MTTNAAASNTNGNAPKRPHLSERERAQMKYVENLSGIRDAFWNRIINGSSSCDLRDLWEACGYGDIDHINPQWYRTLYDTFSIANRICRLLPAETWQAPPSVYEDEDADSVTDFEQAWNDIPKGLASGGQTWHQDENGSVIWTYLEDLDVLSGIGSFGVMLFGFDDGKNLQDPVDGIQVLDPSKKKPIPDTPFKSMKNGKVTDEQHLLNEDVKNGLLEPALNYSNPDSECNQVRNVVKDKGQYPNTPQNPARTDPRTTQSFDSQNHPNIQGRNPTSAGSGQAPPNQGYSDGTVGTPGAGPFVQGTDQQYERTSGMGMAYPAGAALSGTDQQYFGVQFGPSEEFGPPTKQQRRLLFLRVFDESLVQVVRYEWNIRNPRFGLPVMYRITLNDPRTPHGGVGLPLATVYVHWSRVLHIPSGGSPVPSPIFGIPLMKPNLEHLLPLRKIYAADGQGYWKNAFNKLVLTTHPTLGGDVDLEQMGGKAQLQEDVDLFNDPMTNQALMMIGMDAKTLPPAVTDPTPHCEVHLKAIALQMDVPYPVFQGYEIGEQASENNQDIWNNRKRGRQLKRNTFILVSFIDRLIAVGVLPVPKQQKKEMKEDGKTVTGDPDFVQKPLRPPGSQQPAAPAGGGSGDKGGYTGPKGDWQAEQAAGAELKGGEEQQPQKPQPTANRRRIGSMIYACNAEGDIEKDSNGKPKAVGVVTQAGYSIEWPDVDALSEKDQAAVCLQQVQADAAYIAGGNDQLIHPRDYLTRYKKFSEEEAEAILQTTAESQQEQQEQADQLAEEQGLEPIPPEGYQLPQEDTPPQIAVGPGEKIHHASDLKPGSPLVGQKQVPGAGPQQPFGAPGMDKGAVGKENKRRFSGKKPTVNELVVNVTPTELRDSLGRWIASLPAMSGGAYPLTADKIFEASVHADMAEDTEVVPHAVNKLRLAIHAWHQGEPIRVTKFHAMNETAFEHVSHRNADGTPLRVRATGKCQTWKTRPNDFKLPVKYGLRESLYITPANSHEWRPVRSRDQVVRGAMFDLRQAVQHHLWKQNTSQNYPRRIDNTLRSHHANLNELVDNSNPKGCNQYKTCEGKSPSGRWEFVAEDWDDIHQALLRTDMESKSAREILKALDDSIHMDMNGKAELREEDIPDRVAGSSKSWILDTLHMRGLIKPINELVGNADFNAKELRDSLGRWVHSVETVGYRRLMTPEEAIRGATHADMAQDIGVADRESYGVHEAYRRWGQEEPGKERDDKFRLAMGKLHKAVSEHVLHQSRFTGRNAIEYLSSKYRVPIVEGRNKTTDLTEGPPKPLPDFIHSVTGQHSPRSEYPTSSIKPLTVTIQGHRFVTSGQKQERLFYQTPTHRANMNEGIRGNEVKNWEHLLRVEERHLTPTGNNLLVGNYSPKDSSTIEGKLAIAVAKARDMANTGPDYQRLFWDAKRRIAWWESADGDEGDQVQTILDAIAAVPGVRHVSCDAETQPKDGGNWKEITYNTLRSHHAIKADLLVACEELAQHRLCMPGYGSLDMKNDGSGEVWWTGGDSDGEGFDEVVKERLEKIAGITKVYYYIEVPPPREGGALTGEGAAFGASGAPLWDEVWTASGREYRSVYSQLPTLKELEGS